MFERIITGEESIGQKEAFLYSFNFRVRYVAWAAVFAAAAPCVSSLFDKHNNPF